MEAEGPELVSTLQAAKSFVKYIRKSDMAVLLLKTGNQITFFPSQFTCPIRQVYEKRHEKLEAHG